MPDSFPRDPGHPAILGHQAEGEWHRLRQQLDLADGFWLGFLFTTSPVVTRAFRDRTENILRSRARILQAIEPETPEELETSLPRLFEATPNTGCLWLEAPRIDLPKTDDHEPGPWSSAWDRLLLRVNERRERLRRSLDCGLVLVAHPRIKPRIRDAAPDLWSIRSIVLEPVPGPLDRPIMRLGEDYGLDLQQERTLPSAQPKRPTADSPSEVREPEVEYGENPRDPAPTAARLLRRAAGDLQAGNSRDAIDHAVRAIEILDSIQTTEGPDRADAYAFLAEAELADDDPASAEVHLQKALDLLDDDLDRRALQWLDNVDEIVRNRGDLAASETYCRQGVHRTRSRIETEGESSSTLRDLSISLERLGDTLRDRGETEQAISAFQESLDIRRRLLDSHGESPLALRDLSVSLNKLGDTLRDRGETEQAINAFQESLDIARRLLDSYGESPQALRDLSVSLDKLGDTLRDRGETEQAISAFQEGLDIARKLLDSYGESPLALRDLAIVLFHLGRLHRSRSAPEDAERFLAEAADLERRRAESYGIHPGEPPALLIVLRELASLLDEVKDDEVAEAVRAELAALGDEPDAEEPSGQS